MKLSSSLFSLVVVGALLAPGLWSDGARAAPHNFSWTELTHKAVKMYRPQIERSDVIKALGPPAFAVTNKDDNEIAHALSDGDVVLVWDNGNRCEPIFVGFRNDVAVGAKFGIQCAPGASIVIKAKWHTLGWVTARCIHKDRRALCRQNAGAVSRPVANATP